MLKLVWVGKFQLVLDAWMSLLNLILLPLLPPMAATVHRNTLPTIIAMVYLSLINTVVHYRTFDNLWKISLILPTAGFNKWAFMRCLKSVLWNQLLLLCPLICFPVLWGYITCNFASYIACCRLKNKVITLYFAILTSLRDKYLYAMTWMWFPEETRIHVDL